MWYNLTLEYVPQRVPRGAERVFTMGLFTKLFGTRSEREVKKLEPQVEAVMALEEPYKKLTDQELRAKTQEFKARYASGETLDALLPEAFAVCREAADRVLGMRPYRVCESRGFGHKKEGENFDTPSSLLCLPICLRFCKPVALTLPSSS